MAGRGLAAILICSLGYIVIGLVSAFLFYRVLGIGFATSGFQLEVVIPYTVSAIVIMIGAIKHNEHS